MSTRKSKWKKPSRKFNQRQTKRVNGGKKFNLETLELKLISKVDSKDLDGINKILNILKQKHIYLADLRYDYLYIMCVSKNTSFEIAELLINNGADVNKDLNRMHSLFNTIKRQLLNLDLAINYSNEYEDKLYDYVMSVIPVAKLFINRGAIINDATLESFVETINIFEQRYETQSKYQNKNKLREVTRSLRELNGFIYFKPRSGLLNLVEGTRPNLQEEISDTYLTLLYTIFQAILIKTHEIHKCDGKRKIIVF
jgi:hypothetical protein